MNIPKLQTIDRVVGVPLCFVLTCLRRVLPRRLLDAGFAFRQPELGPALADILKP